MWIRVHGPANWRRDYAPDLNVLMSSKGVSRRKSRVPEHTVYMRFVPTAGSRATIHHTFWRTMDTEMLF